MRFAFVDAEKASHRISTLCRVMGISRAGYYQWRNRPPSQRELDDQSLLVAIEAVFKRSKCRYGSPRVHREPRSSGVRVGLNRVARLMCKNGLAVKPHKGFRCTTVRDLSHPVAPNLLARDFSAAAPGEKWVSDVTEFTTGEGTLYLAPVIDLFNREVVGHACSARNDQKLTTSALRAAIDTHGAPEGLIHHSDRGSTYTGGGFREALSSNGIVCSMSRKGDCRDNSVAESFFATIKKELIHRSSFATHAEAEIAIFEYIEMFYNRDRLHSAIGYCSPVDYRLKNASPALST